MRKGLSIIRLVAAGSVAAMMGLAGSAFANSNTMPADTQAGDGARSITGYTVSAVHYGLNATDPTKVDSVTFTLDSTPLTGSVIKIQVNGTRWYSCTFSTTSVTCNTADDAATTTVDEQATVTGATNLRVIVAD